MTAQALGRATPAAAAAAEATSLTGAAGAAGDSMAVAAWTIVSRVSGVARIAVIGAVLGPTFFGNTFQFTNYLPNLVYFGFLAGSLFSSLLVPALVRHIDSGERRACERIAGGFIGITLLALVPLALLAVVLGPLVLRLGALGAHHPVVGAAQEHLGRWLILMMIPQIFLYAVVGTSSAVMNAHRRFALAAAAPALENLGTVAVLLTTALIFGTRANLGSVPAGEILLLGFGATGAVALHAAAQWWGARRVGVVVVPRAGWRNPEVREVVRRALPSLAQAGLVALQVMTILTVANRVAGGVVAFQIALNFFYLPIAVGATPVALSLLPRLARLHAAGAAVEFRDALVRGFALAFFVTIPAAVGYIALARPLARAVSFGRMDSSVGVTLVTAALATLAAGIAGQTAFMVAMYASYAQKDTRAPLRAMLVQASVCLGIVGVALFLRGTAVLVALGLAFSVSNLASAWHLTSAVRRRLPAGSERLVPSLLRVAAGAALMAPLAWAAALVAGHLVPGRLGTAAALVVAIGTGCAAYLALQVLWKAPEIGWVTGGFGHLVGRGSGRS